MGDPAWFDWLVSLWGITNPTTFMKYMPGASWASEPQVALGGGLGLRWGHRETFNRFNPRELLLSGIARCDFRWLMT